MKPSESSTPANQQAHFVQGSSIMLGKWNFYFLVKFLLLWKGMIGFHPLENLAFALFLLFPVQSSLGRKLKLSAAIFIATVLLYYDSWLPSINRVLSQASLLSHFDAAYLLELAGRFVNVPLLAMLFIAWVVFRLVMLRVRLGAIVVSTLTVMLVFQQFGQHSLAQENHTHHEAASETQENHKPDFDKVLSDFYSKEATRSVSFPTPSAEALPFDVIFMHICSLSWDDVKAMGLNRHPLWKRFDFLFTRFNSAASYSGPAAIRILRANCGQSSNDGVYQPASGQCYLMSSLKRSGFESNLVMNHDGHFDDFLSTVQAQHLNIPPMSLNGLLVAQHAFDEAPIYDDLSVLKHWLSLREESNNTRVALYYNTISLHDGNRLEGRALKLDSLATYKIRLAKLLDELSTFMVDLEQSGRRAVVVMVPEHGAAVRGDKMQIPGLREIPSPRITLVPVAIKVIGEGGSRQGETLMIDAETSYLAISEIVARMLKTSPFNGSAYKPADYVKDLPTTALVSQNENSVVLRNKGQYFWQQSNEDWAEYK